MKSDFFSRFFSFSKPPILFTNVNFAKEFINICYNNRIFAEFSITL